MTKKIQQTLHATYGTTGQLFRPYKKKPKTPNANTAPPPPQEKGKKKEKKMK